MSVETADQEPPKFRVGAALTRSFSVLFRNIAPFGILALIFNAPVQLLPLFFDQTGGTPSGGFDLVSIMLLLAKLVIGFMLSATLVYGTVLEMRGGRANLLECMSRGLSLLFPVIGVGLLVGILIALFSLLFVIPGIIAAVMLWVAVPAAVVERPGIGASLNRSIELTKGYRWPLFGLILILLIINTAIGGAVGGVIGFGSGMVSGGVLTPGFLVAINLVVQAFSAALFAVASAVVYHDLRIAKEGASIDEIAAVFD